MLMTAKRFADDVADDGMAMTLLMKATTLDNGNNVADDGDDIC